MRRGIGYLVAAAIVGASIWLASYLVSPAPKPERQARASQIPFAQAVRVVAGSGAMPVYGAGTVTVGAAVDIAPRASGRVGDASYPWQGYVDRAEVSLEEQTRTIDLIVRAPNPFPSGDPVEGVTSAGDSPTLLVRKFVEVEIQGISPESYFRLPRPAPRRGPEVWVVGEDQRVSIVPARGLQRINDQATVVGSLQVGQVVITGGIQFAIPGMVVGTVADLG